MCNDSKGYFVKLAVDQALELLYEEIDVGRVSEAK